MKIIYNSIISGLFVTLTLLCYSQAERSAFTSTGRGAVSTTFATDYQTIGINPANLGWDKKYEGKTITVGAFEGNYGFYSEALSKQKVRDNLMDFEVDNFTLEEKFEAAEEFVNRGMGFNIDLMSIGGAVNTKKLGGFAFSVRDRSNMFLRLNKDASNIIFLGKFSSYFDRSILENGDTINNTGNLSKDTLKMIKKGFSSDPKSIADLLGNTKGKLVWYRE
ncbi:MAG: hypothetical protein ABEH43_08400, partial [Flavobacteriales bacterium]